MVETAVADAIVLGHIVAQCVFVYLLSQIRRPVPANFVDIPLNSVHKSISWQAEVITIQNRTYDPSVQKPYNRKTLYVTLFVSCGILLGIPKSIQMAHLATLARFCHLGTI